MCLPPERIMLNLEKYNSVWIYKSSASLLRLIARHMGKLIQRAFFKPQGRPIDLSTPLTKSQQVPSSTNRVYSVIHPSLVSLPTVYATGVVLPLMSFWNAVIYTTTSWQAVRLLFSGKLNDQQQGSVRSFNSRPSLSARRWTGAESDNVKGLAVGQGSGYDQV